MEKAILEKWYQVPSSVGIGKIFVFLGKAASGKTEVSRDISRELGVEEVVSHTSRPPRPGEVYGKDYYFCNYDDFNEEDFIEIKEFNGWRYGAKKDSIQDGKNYVVVLEPEGYRNYKRVFGDRVVGIYIMAPMEERFKRYTERDGNVDEAVRRFMTDENDFEEFEYEAEYVIINNKEYSDLICKALDILHEELYE